MTYELYFDIFDPPKEFEFVDLYKTSNYTNEENNQSEYKYVDFMDKLEWVNVNRIAYNLDESKFACEMYG